MLSGFLIVQSWRRRPSITVFLCNRALRIYPGFLVATLGSVLLVGVIGSSQPVDYIIHLQLKHLLWDLVLLRTPVTPATFPNDPFPLVNGSLWTISYEFGCYLCIAVVGTCGLIKYRRAFLGLTLLVTGARLMPIYASLALNFTRAQFNRACMEYLYSIFLFLSDRMLFLHLLLYFLAGGCFALFRNRIRFSALYAWAGLFAVIPCMFSPVASQLALLSLGAYALFTFAFARFPVLDLFKGTTDISYGVYLYGWPTQKLILWCLPALSPSALFLFSFLVSAAAGWLSWRCVELPFLRLKRCLGYPLKSFVALGPETAKDPSAQAGKPPSINGPSRGRGSAFASISPIHLKRHPTGGLPAARRGSVGKWLR